MKNAHLKWILWVLFLVSAGRGWSQAVVINEIMYHPSSEDVLEEYIELYNGASTNVQVGQWRITRGVEYTVPAGTVIPAGGYLVVAADEASFRSKYGNGPAMVGGWAGILSNSRNRIDLEDAAGRRMDTVSYADEGDWAVRQQGPSLSGRRGWDWFKEHDGLGPSLELIHPDLPNEHGQSWAASLQTQGTPGAANSVLSGNIAPLILTPSHTPLIPSSSDPIRITARVWDDQGSLAQVRLHWRLDSGSPPPFTAADMFDDGLHGDGAAGDGLYGLMLPAQANDAVVEYFFEAMDGQGNSRTWPAPVRGAPDLGGGSLGQILNALLQVDDNPNNTFDGASPVYKMIMTVSQRQELSTTLSSYRNSDAQYHGTFLSLDGNGISLHHQVGVRNRGHGSRGRVPHNFRVNFRSDDPWKDVVAINLNANNPHAQHLGAVAALRAGAVGANSTAVLLRFNNSATPVGGGSAELGHYAANEVVNGDWAENHFPDNGGGEVYKVVRDIKPPNFEYRGENISGYRITYFKSTKESEDDWTHLIDMLRVAGENASPYDPDLIRQHANVEQWMTHLAVMNIFANRESGINTGNNDDYFIYTGDADPRAMFVYHDLDSVMGVSSFNTSLGIFSAACDAGVGCPVSGDSEGIWRAMALFMHHPEFEPIYYRTMSRLLSTTFSAAQFDPMVDQTLGHYVSTGQRDQFKSWMAARRSFIQGVISGRVPPSPSFGVISGEPRSPTRNSSATLTVSGTDVVEYRYRLNDGPYGNPTSAGQPIQLSGLANGSTNQVSVVVRNVSGVWQSMETPTLSRRWVVNSGGSTVRLNEVLARNDMAVNHEGTFPDIIELYNELPVAADISGFRLTNEKDTPNKFVFPEGTTLPGLGYLVLYANNADGTSGIHLGFSLDQEGDEVYLYDREVGGLGILDSLEFGPQLTDASVGRRGFFGRWLAGTPTPGGVNDDSLALGSARGLKINEWLAAAQVPLTDDYVELYNPGSLPVDLGGLHLTDNPIGDPRQHEFRETSLIPAGGFLSYRADGRTRAGHVDLRLASEGGRIALLDAWLQTIDDVVYGPQTLGISLGRCPDGQSTVLAQEVNTPGAPNLCPQGEIPPELVNIIAYDHVWRFEDSDTALDPSWREPGYDDGPWATGATLIGFENGDTPVQPFGTIISRVNGRVTTYYRTRFDLDVAGLNAAAVQIHHVIDDGAVFYLNGTEIGRYGLPGGAIDHSTTASTVVNAVEEGPIDVPLNLVQPTENVLAVELHQNNNNSADQLFGLRLDAVVVTNIPSRAGVVINEILADNASLEESPGVTPDLAEFYNPSDSAVNLEGLGLSDELLQPHKWVFPSGSILPARGYFVVRLDGDQPASDANTGFGLSASGETLYLFDKAANGGGLLDSVQFGLQAADFSIGRVAAQGGGWRLTLPTLGEANQAVLLGDPALVRINEWRANSGNEDDWFELYNTGTMPVELSGYYLTDDLANYAKSVIQPLSFMGSETNAWRKMVADGNLGSGANHVSFNLNGTDGEAIGFFAANGAQIDAVSFGPQAAGVSEGRFPDGDGPVVAFPGTASPGERNFRPLTGVVINEVLSHTDPPFEDAIEVVNLSGAPVDISGWWLSDARTVPFKFQVDNGTVLPAGGYAVFYESEFNDSDIAPVPFALSSAKGDEVHLFSAAGGLLDGFRTEADFGPSANGVSFGRHPTSIGTDFTAMSRLTFGVDSPSTVAEFRQGTGQANAAPLVGPVVMTEIMYHPVPLGTNDNTRDEFIELHNLTLNDVPLFDPAFPTNTWRLRRGADYDFPMGVVVPAGGFIIVVSFDPATDALERAQFEAVYGPDLVLFGPYRGKLDNGGEALELRRPDTPQMIPGPDFGLVPYIAVDRVVYGDEAPWPTGGDGDGLSLQRLSPELYGNDPAHWQAAVPSPSPGGSGLTDSDGDQMPDDWETANGTNPNRRDGDEDMDGDGLTNLEEFQAGTDPRDPGSNLKLTARSRFDGRVELQFQAVAGKTYSVLYQEVLQPGSWSVFTNIAAPAIAQPITVVDEASGGGGQRFYQVVTPRRP